MAVRLTIKVSVGTYESLKTLADREGTPMTEIVKRAVALYRVVDEEVTAKGQQLKMVDKNNRETMLAIV